MGYVPPYQYLIMNKLIVTIDGPAGVGKSTTARMLAEKLGAVFMDTGAMYRAITVAAMDAGIDMEDVAALEAVIDNNTFDFVIGYSEMRVSINGQDATQLIREPSITAKVKYVATPPQLRARLVRMQQQFASQYEKVVTEGRDQGTVAFPDAACKYFRSADPAERARRRHEELKAKGKEHELAEILDAINKRDHSDTSRQVGALKPADDAIIVDTTTLEIQQVVQKMYEEVMKKAVDE